MSLEKQVAVEEALQHAFNEDELRKRLSEEDFKKYFDSKETLNFQKGEVIFEDGEHPKGVYFIEEGTAKLSKSGAYGKDQILRFIKEGDLIGYRSMLCGENFQAKAEAMTDIQCTFLVSIQVPIV